LKTKEVFSELLDGNCGLVRLDLLLSVLVDSRI